MLFHTSDTDKNPRGGEESRQGKPVARRAGSAQEQPRQATTSRRPSASWPCRRRPRLRRGTGALGLVRRKPRQRQAARRRRGRAGHDRARRGRRTGRQERRRGSTSTRNGSTPRATKRPRASSQTWAAQSVTPGQADVATNVGRAAGFIPADPRCFKTKEPAMEKWPLGVFASIDAGLGVQLEVAHELGVPTVQLHAPQKASRTPAAGGAVPRPADELGIRITRRLRRFRGRELCRHPHRDADRGPGAAGHPRGPRHAR